MNNLPLLHSVANITSDFIRFAPEPRTRSGASFAGVLRSVGSAMVDTASSLAGGMDPMYMALIEKQIEVQQQLQLVSFESNIEKSKHETQMSAVRNIRVG